MKYKVNKGLVRKVVFIIGAIWILAVISSFFWDNKVLDIILVASGIALVLIYFYMLIDLLMEDLERQRRDMGLK